MGHRVFKVGDFAIVDNKALSYHKSKVLIIRVDLDIATICLINGTNVYGKDHIIECFSTKWLKLDKNTIVKELINDL